VGIINIRQMWTQSIKQNSYASLLTIAHIINVIRKTSIIIIDVIVLPSSLLSLVLKSPATPRHSRRLADSGGWQRFLVDGAGPGPTFWALLWSSGTNTPS